jgi:hypothetical protein
MCAKPERSAAEGDPVAAAYGVASPSPADRPSRHMPAYPPYPAAERFTGHRLNETNIAEVHAAASSFQDYISHDVARLRALPKLPPPFTPRSHRWIGKPVHEHEGPRATPKRRLGATHRAPKHQEGQP